jgi:hypothetical protein
MLMGYPHVMLAPFRQKSHDLGRGIDFCNVAETLEKLEKIDGPIACPLAR